MEAVPVPALLRSARGVYSRAIRARWAAIGLDQMPRNAPYLLGGMGNAAVPAAELLATMGGTEAAHERLVVDLLRRGLVERTPQGGLQLTDAGSMAARAVAEGIDSVTVELHRRVTPEQWSGFLATVGTLCDMHESWPADSGSGAVPLPAGEAQGSAK